MTGLDSRYFFSSRGSSGIVSLSKYVIIWRDLTVPSNHRSAVSNKELRAMADINHNVSYFNSEWIYQMYYHCNLFPAVFFQKHLLGIFQIVFSDSWTFFIWVKNYQCSTRLYEIVPSCLFIKSKMRFLIETQDFEISSLIRRKKRIEETDRRTDRQTNREREVHKCHN